MKYLFFDLDGTLTDPYEGIAGSILHALSSCGLPPADEKTLRSCIGPPLFDSFTRIFGMSEEQAAFAVSEYRKRYGQVCHLENRLLPFVGEGLKKLGEAGYVMAVATGKPTATAERILSHFGIRESFSAVVGSNLDGTLALKCEEIALAMQKTGAVAAQSAMIGDRFYDIEGGKSLGLYTVGLSCGYAEEGELEAAGADRIFPDFRRMTEFFVCKAKGL